MLHLQLHKTVGLLQIYIMVILRQLENTFLSSKPRTLLFYEIQLSEIKYSSFHFLIVPKQEIVYFESSL